MKPDTEGVVVAGLGGSKGLPVRAYSVRGRGMSSDCPDVGENPLLLFTLAYSELIEAIADTLFPPNDVADTKGGSHLLTASSCRIDRHERL